MNFDEKKTLGAKVYKNWVYNLIAQSRQSLESLESSNYIIVYHIEKVHALIPEEFLLIIEYINPQTF